jgi:TolB-like protein/Tfp pilus assembly protein PilF
MTSPSRKPKYSTAKSDPFGDASVAAVAPAAGTLARVAATLKQLRGPIVAIASVGAVASGLVGYYTTYKTVASNTMATPAAQPAGVDISSIAVLPFVNMSDDKGNEYFSDGLSEELLNLLAQIPQLKVTARTSSFSFKGKGVDVATIVKALKVGHVLEGSVRKSGNTVRITAQLIRGADSYHLWSKTYDRQLTDVFAVQDEIAHDVVEALKVKLLPNQSVARTAGQTKNPEAYRQYLLGHSFFQRYTKEDYILAKAALLKAIALDPTYAAAYAELSFVETNLADGDREDGIDKVERAAAYARSKAAIEKAMVLEPASSRAYLARSRLRQSMGDLGGALSDARHAMQLDPGTANLRYAKSLQFAGKHNEALVLLKKDTLLNPLESENYLFMGLAHLMRGEHHDAQQSFASAMELLPGSAEDAKAGLGISLLLQGQMAQARAAFGKHTSERSREFGLTLVQFRDNGNRDGEEYLAKLIKEHAADRAYDIAQLYAWTGRNDQAFEWLQRKFQQDSRSMVGIQLDVLFKGMHRDPRWLALLRQLGIAPEQLESTKT